MQSVVLAHLKLAKYVKVEKQQHSLGGDDTAAVGGVCPGGEVVHPKEWAAVGGGRDYTHLRWNQD